MPEIIQTKATPWQWWQKVLFRFFFIYFLFYLAPWQWLNIIPGVDFILNYYNQVIEWAVTKSNAQFFHVFGVRDVHAVQNGSGDTSYAWAENIFYLCLAAVGGVIWSLLDRKAKSYRQLNYLLCLFVRYSIASIAFVYGFDKVFDLQMPFPLTSQLATPLGDLLPMRLSRLF